MTRGWPDLASIELDPTIEALHLWSQVVGKVRLMMTPWENHGWHVPLYVSARGLTTGLIPTVGRSFAIEFDFVASRLDLRATDGAHASVALRAQSVCDFYEATMAALAAIGIAVRIDRMPCEIPDAVPFQEDIRLRAYVPAVAATYWRALVEVRRVFQLFRTSFVGKCSPIHLFWGAFDLAITRFSGRTAPPHPGGAPNMPDAVAREAYCWEVSSAGFWPGFGTGPSFYSYAYPVPAGFGQAPVKPSGAAFDPALGEFLLPYSTVIASADPDQALLQFLESTYEAAANLGEWDRAHLERAPGSIGRPPQGS
ncbi:MAG TPA: DUF5996 family protein [Sphingomonas sp.]|uniref:DUF5996 family protein n=1 Tax=Sphingomonas sp. TaxID=28214 RepID=UPI002CCB9241|nr:DUF5996 family protein [Sphingomonas sp.]HMI18925.1 DUF5996 family protein [Sphingomonas sp.]